MGAILLNPLNGCIAIVAVGHKVRIPSVFPAQPGNSYTGSVSGGEVLKIPWHGSYKNFQRPSLQAELSTQSGPRSGLEARLHFDDRDFVLEGKLKMRYKTAGLLLTSLAAAFAQVPNPTQSVQPVVMPDVVFRTTVTSRSIKAINYHHRQGSTTVDFVGTALMNMAKGEAKVDSKTGATKLDIHFDKLGPAQVHGEEFLTYVLWAITPEGRAENLGEVMVEGDDARLQTGTELQAFGMIVTAEPYWAVTQPSDVVVLEGVVKPGSTTGTISPIEAKYELLQKGAYTTRLPAADRAILKQKNDVPLDLKEARHAMNIVRSIGGGTYAADTMVKAQNDLQNAEAIWQAKKDKKKVQTLARNTTQLAEDARIITVKKQQEEKLAAERQEAAAKVAQANSDAERELRQRELAEADRKLALERERQAQIVAQQEELRRRRAEIERAEADAQRAQADAQRVQAEQQALAARQSAEAAKADALKEQQRLMEETDKIRRETEAMRAKAEEERRNLLAETDRARQAAASAEERTRQAEAERLRTREELRQQLNIVLQTRDSARGLIVNMSDVLFDTAQSTLRPGAREKLAKVAGIILAHPDLKLQVEGHTDSVGDDAYNQRLSEQRASSVSNFLTKQGVSFDAISARGFGETTPVASNDNAAGRQQNRRVELVVTGESIKGSASASVPSSVSR
jgi:outer membrane protein OmpA-like peptidoglycan-associated protein